MFFSSIAHCEQDYLLVYSETHLDVFDIKTADWIQSIGLKKPRPLSNDGNVSLMAMNESPCVVHLANMLTRPLLDTECIERSVPRRRFSLRESNRMRTAASDRRSKMISAPTNFNHVSRKFSALSYLIFSLISPICRHGARDPTEVCRFANDH